MISKEEIQSAFQNAYNSVPRNIVTSEYEFETEEIRQFHAMLLRDYNTFMFENGIATDKKSMDKMDSIDMRNVFKKVPALLPGDNEKYSYPAFWSEEFLKAFGNLKGIEKENIEGQSVFGFSNVKFLDCIPCFKEGFLQVADRLWLVFRVIDIQLEESKQCTIEISEYGQHFENINNIPEIRRLRKRLKHIQRLISKKYEANVTIDRNGKKIYHKTNNIRKFEQQERLLYRRISNIKKTYMYEVIGAVLKTKARSIVLEDLNVKGMMQNPHLARAVQEQNLYKFRQILTYKCQKNGIRLFLADRWYPSSKTCSCCGHIKGNLKLYDRTYVCENCGNIMDRDENAAKCLERCLDEWMTEVDFNAV